MTPSPSVICFTGVNSHHHCKLFFCSSNDFFRTHISSWFLTKYLLTQASKYRDEIYFQAGPMTTHSNIYLFSNKRLRNIERLRPVVLFPTRQILVCIVILLTRGLTNGQQQHNLQFLPKTDRQFYQKKLWIIKAI